MAEYVVGQIYDSDKNQLPYGGAVDINGKNRMGRYRRRR